MYRLLTALALACLSALPAAAHGFWINGSTWLLDPAGDDHGAVPNESLIYLGAGHYFPVHEYLNPEKIDRFEVRSESGAVTPLKGTAEGLVSAPFVVKENGGHVVTAMLKPYFYSMYNDGETTRYGAGPKTEFQNVEYSSYNEEYAKALMRTAEGDASFLTKPIGDTFEIVPKSDPFAVKAGPDATLAFTVLLDGKPLAGATVFATHTTHYPRNELAQRHSTNAEGVVTITVDAKGPWLLLAFTSRPIREEWKDKADEEEYAASVTFEVRH